jgi:cytochrome c-type biogenesis protein
MVALAFSFAAGLLTALSPCVLPLLPIIVGSAATAGRLGPLVLASGLVTAFTAVGVLLTAVQGAVGIDDLWLRRVSAAMLVAAGVVLMSAPLQDFVSKIVSPLATLGSRASAQRGRGLAPQFVIGAALGGVWSPCAGPTLGAALGLAAHADTLLRATLLMFVFGVGATVPLLGAAYVSRAVLTSRGSLQRIGSSGKLAFGITLITMGGLVWFGADKMIEGALLARLPDWWVNLLARI